MIAKDGYIDIEKAGTIAISGLIVTTRQKELQDYLMQNQGSN